MNGEDPRSVGERAFVSGGRFGEPRHGIGMQRTFRPCERRRRLDHAIDELRSEFQLVRRREGDLAPEDVALRVAEDPHLGVERAEPVQRADRIGTHGDQIAQHPPSVDTRRSSIRDHGVERHRVAVDVGEHSDPHTPSVAERPSRRMWVVAHCGWERDDPDRNRCLGCSVPVQYTPPTPPGVHTKDESWPTGSPNSPLRPSTRP